MTDKFLNNTPLNPLLPQAFLRSKRGNEKSPPREGCRPRGMPQSGPGLPGFHKGRGGSNRIKFLFECASEKAIISKFKYRAL
jgi:hypothetical protein